MNNAYSFLEWDSNFFGYKVAAIHAYNLGLNELNETISELTIKKCRLIYCFVNPQDKISNISLLRTSGSPVDEKVTFVKKISVESDYERCHFISSYRLSYASEKLRSLALQSGIYSRFKTDLNFRNNEYERLYLEWIEKSVKRKNASDVLVYYENEDIKGFVTILINDNKGSIGLIAVDGQERGKSIGKKLIDSALHSFKEVNVNEVEVVTQMANKGACTFYEKMGFEIKNIINIYHIWIA